MSPRRIINRITPDIIRRLWRRMLMYSAVGIGTFALDLAIIYACTEWLATSDEFALVLGFIVGITTNYLLSYYWVYRGTERNLYTGYTIFVALAVLGSVAIVYSTTWLVDTFALPLLLARTIVAAFVGLANFFINTFFNFRLL